MNKDTVKLLHSNEHILKQNTNVRYKSWELDPDSGLLKITFDTPAHIRAFADDLISFLDSNPDIDPNAELFIGLTNNSKVIN